MAPQLLRRNAKVQRAWARAWATGRDGGGEWELERRGAKDQRAAAALHLTVLGPMKTDK